MVRQETKLKVANNTGVEEPLCVRVLSGSTRRYASTDNITVASVEDITPGSVIKKGGVIKAVMARTARGARRKGGSCIRFDENATAAIKDDKTPRGTHIFGPVAEELRGKQSMKIIPLVSKVLQGGVTANKIRKSDLVVVIASKDKDKWGKIISIDTKKNRVLAQGCNMVAKHIKQVPSKPQGGIVNQEVPTDISSVILVADGKMVRVRFEGKDDRKVRVARTAGKIVD